MNKEIKNTSKTFKFLKWYFRTSFYYMILIMKIVLVFTLIFVIFHLIFPNKYCYNYKNNMITCAYGLIEYNKKNEYLSIYKNENINIDSLFYNKIGYSNKEYVYIGEKESIFIIGYEENSPLVRVFSFTELFNGNFSFWVHEKLLQEEYVDENIWYFYNHNQEYVKVVN